MSFISKTKTFLVGALAVSAAALAAAPAQATDFYDDDGVERVVVVKKRIARPVYDFDDDFRPRTKRVFVERRIVRDFDDFRPRTVFVKKRFVHPRHDFYGHRRVGFGFGVGFHGGHRGFHAY